MAKATETKTAKNELVKIHLPKIRGGKDIDQTFEVGINGRFYTIKRGVEMEVPPEVAQIIELSEKAIDEQYDYISEKESM